MQGARVGGKIVLSQFIQLPIEQLILAVLIVFAAFVITGISGFGSGLIAIPMLAFFLPLPLVVAVLTLLSYGSTVIQSIALRQHTCWQEVWSLLPFTLVGIALALLMLAHTDLQNMAVILGFFIAGYALYALFDLKPLGGSRVWSIFAGGFGGFIGTLFGTGGPFYVIYLNLRQLDKSQFRATIATTFLIDGGVRVAGYATIGYFTPQVLILTLLLVPVLIVGLMIGHAIHFKINQRQFHLVINLMLLLSGCLLIIKSL